MNILITGLVCVDEFLDFRILEHSFVYLLVRGQGGNNILKSKWEVETDRFSSKTYRGEGF